MINTIKLKGVVMEDFCNYQKPSMYLATSFCDWKCCLEQKLSLETCQNSILAKTPSQDFAIEHIYNAYRQNDISKAIVIGGLEPFLQFNEIKALIDFFRKNRCQDDFVIYTGYKEEELEQELRDLSQYENIIVKFGRYIPNQKSHLDDTLGIYLASYNQYSKKIS